MWIARSFAFSSNTATKLQSIYVDYLSVEEALQLRCKISAAEEQPVDLVCGYLVNSPSFCVCVHLFG